MAPFRVDPLFYLVDATRKGSTGFNETTVWVAIVIAAAAAAAIFL